MALYRVTMVVGDMGWVDYDFGQSTICRVLPRQMGDWHNRLGKVVEHTKSRSIKPLSPCTSAAFFANQLVSSLVWTTQKFALYPECHCIRYDLTSGMAL